MNDDNQSQQLETTKELYNSLRRQDWYIYFIEELEALVIEGEYNARWELLKTYHEVGRLITEKSESFNKSNIYATNIYDVVAEDIKKSKSTVYKAVEFYKKYPNALTDVSSLPEGKNLSWSKLTSKYLHEPRKDDDSPVEIIENTSAEPINNNEQSSPVITQNTIDEANFTLKDILIFYLETAKSVTEVKVIANIYIIYLLNKYSINDLKKIINIYAVEKNEIEFKLLNTLLELLDTAENQITPSTSPLFENVPVKNELNSNSLGRQAPNNPVLIKEFIALYVQLYANKYHRKPLTGPKIFAVIGKLLKIKISQGYSFVELLSLLKIYSEPKNSDFCNFALHPFFSDNVFNNLLAQKSKSSEIVQEGKYSKYE